MMDIGGIAGWYIRHFYDRHEALTDDFGQRSVGKVIKQVVEHDEWIKFNRRVGYVSSYPAPVSLRRPPDWFLRG